MARPPKDKALARLQKSLDQISELKHLPESPSGPAESPNFLKWKRNTRIAIANTFGYTSDQVGEFCYIDFTWDDCVSVQKIREAYVSGLEESTALLESMIDEVNEYWEEGAQYFDISVDDEGIPKSEKEIFVVHGHDEIARETVIGFLENLKLEPIVLHEQASTYRTVIEKFEDYTDIAFAVVLLTPDDVGKKKNEPSDLKPRARQNVIFELGFFLGFLGREYVFPLVKGDVETPSDYDGVVYTKLDDAGGWKLKLLQELKAADVDFNPGEAI